MVGHAPRQRLVQRHPDPENLVERQIFAIPGIILSAIFGGHQDRTTKAAAAPAASTHSAAAAATHAAATTKKEASTTKSSTHRVAAATSSTSKVENVSFPSLTATPTATSPGSTALASDPLVVLTSTSLTATNTSSSDPGTTSFLKNPALSGAVFGIISIIIVIILAVIATGCIRKQRRKKAGNGIISFDPAAMGGAGVRDDDSEHYERIIAIDKGREAVGRQGRGSMERHLMSPESTTSHGHATGARVDRSNSLSRHTYSPPQSNTNTFSSAQSNRYSPPQQPAYAHQGNGYNSQPGIFSNLEPYSPMAQTREIGPGGIYPYPISQPQGGNPYLSQPSPTYDRTRGLPAIPLNLDDPPTPPALNIITPTPNGSSLGHLNSANTSNAASIGHISSDNTTPMPALPVPRSPLGIPTEVKGWGRAASSDLVPLHPDHATSAIPPSPPEKKNPFLSDDEMSLRRQQNGATKRESGSTAARLAYGVNDY